MASRTSISSSLSTSSCCGGTHHGTGQCNLPSSIVVGRQQFMGMDCHQQQPLTVWDLSCEGSQQQSAHMMRGPYLNHIVQEFLVWECTDSTPAHTSILHKCWELALTRTLQPPPASPSHLSHLLGANTILQCFSCGSLLVVGKCVHVC